MIFIERIYDKSPRRADTRFLVERLWPRGIKKDALRLDGWLKDAAPSNALRKWYGHKPERFIEFRKRYLAELRSNSISWKPIVEAARKGDVALLYSARDTVRNSANVLLQFLGSQGGARRRPAGQQAAEGRTD